jgi:hypothetical protein
VTSNRRKDEGCDTNPVTDWGDTEAALATIVRFAGRAVGVDGGLDVLEAASYLKAELERVRAERDHYRFHFDQFEARLDRAVEALGYVEVTLDDPGDYLSLDVGKMLREVRAARAEIEESDVSR